MYIFSIEIADPNELLHLSHRFGWRSVVSYSNFIFRGHVTWLTIWPKYSSSFLAKKHVGVRKRMSLSASMPIVVLRCIYKVFVEGVAKYQNIVKGKRG